MRAAKAAGSARRSRTARRASSSEPAPAPAALTPPRVADEELDVVGGQSAEGPLEGQVVGQVGGAAVGEEEVEVLGPLLAGDVGDVGARGAEHAAGGGVEEDEAEVA